MLQTGTKLEMTQRTLDSLYECSILGFEVQGMHLSAQKAAGSIPELIKVRAMSGVELKVIAIADGIWQLEVTRTTS